MGAVPGTARLIAKGSRARIRLSRWHMASRTLLPCSELRTAVAKSAPTVRYGWNTSLR